MCLCAARGRAATVAVRGHGKDLVMSDSQVNYGNGNVQINVDDESPATRAEVQRLLAFQSQRYAEYADATAKTVAYTEAMRVQAEAKAEEDKRANKRNFNRMLTLVAALIIGLAVTFILNHGYLGHWGPALAPYSFVITVMLDSFLAAYSYIRHY